MASAAWTAGIGAQGAASLLGRITNLADGSVLGDAQISVTGLGIGVLSGEEGWYFLTGIPVGRHEVAVTLLGFQTALDTVELEAGDAVNLHFQLQPIPIEVEGLVVEAEPIRGREVGNRRVIGQEELARTQASSTTELLRGLVAGLSLTTTSGSVGAGSRIRLRGVRSLRGNPPLFFVDDVRIGSSDFRGPVGTGGSILTFLDNIKPSDIDRIEILQGSEATLLYGTDGAGGAILIYTKRGGIG